MKNFKKMMALALAMVMVLAMGTTVFAATQTVGTAATGKGSITINNAAKGETYKVTKIFDATVTGEDGGSIAYYGDIPSGLETYFEVMKDNSGATLTEKTSGKPYVKLKDGADETALFAKLKELYGSATGGTECTGSPMVFAGLDYGYYVVSTSQGESAITVTSTNPDPEVYDKNTTTPQVVKSVNDADVYIGQTVTYTLDNTTTNWLGQGKNAKQVVKYEIQDTTPNFLSDVTVTSIIVDNDGNTETTDDQTPLEVQQFSNKKITIPWATGSKGNYTNTYKNGAHIIITYTAKVTAQANVGDADGNRNEVTLQPYVDNGNDNPEPSQENFKDDETIKTYGAALKKVDEKGDPLAGAKFAINGLTVTGSDGEYTVTAFDAASTTLGTEMECDDEGVLIIFGLASDVNLTATETKAPDGYNKLDKPVTLTPIKMSETVSFTAKTVYYDSDDEATRKVVHEEVTGGSTKTVLATGNDLKNNANCLKVVNNKGVQLPSTGGIGTTIFYIIGGILILGAAIALIGKKKFAR